MKIRILLVCAQRIIRESLGFMLKAQPELDVVGMACDKAETLRLTDHLAPDVVLLDVDEAHSQDWMNAISEIAAERVGVKVIVLTALCDRLFVMKMMKAGAAAYLLKTCGLEELCMAIRAVKDKRNYLSPQIAHYVIQAFLHQSRISSASKSNLLTQREEEVLQLLANGYSAEDIASLLNLNRRTVQSYRRNIMKKLNIHKTSELREYIVRNEVDARGG